jgi:hypothetical protein
MRNIVFISLTLLAGAVGVSADQGVAFPRSAAQLGAQRPAQNDPYAKLFETRGAVKDALQQAQQQMKAQPAPKKRIVCGTTIIEADQFFDQKMMVSPPKDPNLRYTIRAVEPPICK